VESMNRNFTEKMWCKCGSHRSAAPYIGPIWALRSALTSDFLGADDGIRTRDPHLGKKTRDDDARLPYLRLCNLMQRDQRFRLTATDRY
jgi:hypothetical protein